MSNHTEACDLSQVMPLETYRADRVHLLPSRGSLQWLVRQHKDRLVQCGALLLIRGTWYVNARPFDAELLAIGQAEAQALTNAAA